MDRIIKGTLTTEHDIEFGISGIKAGNAKEKARYKALIKVYLMIARLFGYSFTFEDETPQAETEAGDG